jgi:3',5'-nucleoside bisphosphate phosphatase
MNQKNYFSAGKNIYSRKNRKAKREYADLHMHSTLSDGALSVEELVQLASRKNLKAISITDHDDLDSYEKALPLATELGIEMIPGIEFSAVHEGRDVHIMGYFCDVTNLTLN